MNKKTNVSVNSFPIALVLFIVFFILKVTGVITWSWIWVTSPLWISFGLFIIFFAIVLMFIGGVSILALAGVKK